jgi:hypothetical protein
MLSDLYPPVPRAFSTTPGEPGVSPLRSRWVSRWPQKVSCEF